MLVRDYMTIHVHTVMPDDTISDALCLMRQKKIKHLPVVTADRQVAGIVSDRDIKEYIPSKGTSLDIYELNYLLARTNVDGIMKSPVLTAAPDMTVEEAAMIMHDKDIGCLPVVEDKKLVGIISDTDIFRVLIEITGVRSGGHRIAAVIDDASGSIKVLADVIREHGFRLQSIMSTSEKAPPGKRYVVIRTRGEGDFAALEAAISATPGLGVVHKV